MKKLIIVILIPLLIGLGISVKKSSENYENKEVNKETNEDIAYGACSLLKQLTKEEVVAQSNLIIEGEVIKKSEPFMIKPVNGIPEWPYYEYTVKAKDIFKNNTDIKGDTFKVLAQAEKYKGVDYNNDEPRFNTGDSKLFLLDKQDIGAYVIEGDYFYITGVSQGIFEIYDPVIKLFFKGNIEDNSDETKSIKEILEPERFEKELNNYANREK